MRFLTRFRRLYIWNGILAEQADSWKPAYGSKTYINEYFRKVRYHKAIIKLNNHKDYKNMRFVLFSTRFGSLVKLLQTMGGYPNIQWHFPRLYSHPSKGLKNEVSHCQSCSSTPMKLWVRGLLKHTDVKHSRLRMSHFILIDYLSSLGHIIVTTTKWFDNICHDHPDLPRTKNGVI